MRKKFNESEVQWIMEKPEREWFVDQSHRYFSEQFMRNFTLFQKDKKHQEIVRKYYEELKKQGI